MHSYPRNLVEIRRVVVYYARSAHGGEPPWPSGYNVWPPIYRQIGTQRGGSFYFTPLSKQIGYDPCGVYSYVKLTCLVTSRQVTLHGKGREEWVITSHSTAYFIPQ